MSGANAKKTLVIKFAPLAGKTIAPARPSRRCICSVSATHMPPEGSKRKRNPSDHGRDPRLTATTRKGPWLLVGDGIIYAEGDHGHTEWNVSLHSRTLPLSHSLFLSLSSIFEFCSFYLGLG